MTDNAPRQAIALTYDGANAPTLSAKGDDELAEAILAIAREHEVPIYENAELVRLLARLELGDAIPEALYRTLAALAKDGLITRTRSTITLQQGRRT